MKILSRKRWGAAPRKHHPGTLDPADVDGLAFHWPGHSNRLDRDEIPAALRGWQSYHMNGHGWSDIAYQVAVDQWGRVWQLRGLANRSAANGDYDLNGRFGAVLLVVATGEPLSDELVTAAREVVAEHRRLFPRSRRLVGHGEIRPDGTSCPGPHVQQAIDAGRFEPAGKEGFVMRQGDADEIREIVRDELRTAVARPSWGALWRVEALLRELVRRMGSSPAKVIDDARRARKRAAK